MDEKCFIGIGVIAVVAIALFVVVPVVVEKTQPVSVNSMITHYDEDGNPIRVEPEPWWGNLIPGAFSKSGTDIASTWDVSVEYTVSGQAYESLEVTVDIDVEIVKEIFSMQQGVWVTEQTYTDSFSSMYHDEINTVTQDYDYDVLITDLDEESRYIVTVSVSLSASATSSDTGEGLAASWSDSVNWQIDWSSDSTLDITGNLVA